jgi:hypothetical protein
MKKLLFIGLILAIFILAMPQGVMALSDIKTAEVSATVADTCIVTASFVPPSGGWNLLRNNANALPNGIHVTVDSSSPWGLVATDEKGTDKGKMISTVGAIPLQTAFVFDGVGLATAHTLFPSGKAAQPVTGYDYAIGQPVTALDNSALDYTITVTFTLTAI